MKLCEKCFEGYMWFYLGIQESELVYASLLAVEDAIMVDFWFTEVS